MAIEVRFAGERDAANPNIIHYVGNAGTIAGTYYSDLTLDFNLVTGDWTANVPPGFPAGVQVSASWIDLDPHVVRPEPTTRLQSAIGRPESDIISPDSPRPWHTEQPGLDAYWKLEESIGHVRVDSEDGHDLTPDTGYFGNQVSSDIGIVGTCAYGSSTSYGLLINDAFNISNKSFSLTFWAKQFPAAQPFYQWVLSQCQTADPVHGLGNDIEFGIYNYYPFGNFEWHVFQNDGTDILLDSGAGAFVTNVWFFFACGYDDVNKVSWISVNGAPRITTPCNSARSHTHTDFRLFWVSGSSNYLNIPNCFYGWIDEAAFWSRNMTDDEISAYYNGTRKFDEFETITVYGTVPGTVDFELFDDAPWHRSLTGDRERRLMTDMDLTGPSCHAIATLTIPTVLDQSNVPYTLSTVKGLTSALPLQTSAAVSDEFGDPCFAIAVPGTVAGTVISNDPILTPTGLVYGVLVSDPQSFFTPTFRDGLWEWWPFNEHPESNLTVFERVWGGSTDLDGFLDTDRTLIEDWGWALHVPRERSITLPFHEATAFGSMTLTERFQLVNDLGDGTSTLFAIDSLRVTVESSSGSYTLRVEVWSGGTWTTEASTSVSLGVDYYLAIVFDGSVVSRFLLYAETDVDPAPTFSGGPFADTADLTGSIEASISCDLLTFYVYDLRIWTSEKTDTELKAMRRRVIHEAPQARWPSVVPTEQGSGYALLTWARSGFVYPGGPSPTIVGGTMATWLLEKESVSILLKAARVFDDIRVEDLGFGGGQAIVEPWTLGSQFSLVLADSRAVVASSMGVIGDNPIWEGEFGPWEPEANRNITAHRAWFSGSGKSWDIEVKSTIGGPALVAIEEDLGGMGSALVDAGHEALEVMTTGSIVTTGTVDHGANMFLYSPTSVVVDIAGIDEWVDQNSFGLGQNPPVAAIDSRGKLTFYVATALSAGPYRLTLDAGNIGQVASDFVGLQVDVTIAQSSTYSLTVRGDGQVDPRGYVTLDFELDSAIASGWLLELAWGGKLDFPQLNIGYALAVYGFTIESRLPVLYRVDSPADLTQVIATTHVVNPIYPGGTIPGGWVGVVGPSGSIVDWIHESEADLRPLMTGFLASVPSETITGLSMRRAEDILLASSPWSLPDPSAPSAPTVTVSGPLTGLEGDTLTYTVSGVANAVSLVWQFWDGEVRTTDATVTSQDKVANAGGSCTVTVTAINEVGDTALDSATTLVDFAPVIVNVVVSKNDSVAPYSSTVTVVATDPDSAPSGAFPGSKIYGTLAGTIQSTSSTVSGTLYGTLNFGVTVTTDAEEDLVLTDDYGSSNTYPLMFRTKPSRPVLVVASASPPSLKLGPNASVTLTAVATDLDGEAIVSFDWALLVANGWSSDQHLSGTSRVLGGGATQNSVIVDCSAESAGTVTVTITVTTATGKTGTSDLSVVFEPASAPVINHFDILGIVTPGNLTTVSAYVTDPGNSPLSYAWVFDDPSGVTRYGNPVQVIASGPVIKGTLTATDAVGDSVTEAIPPILLSSQLNVVGTIGEQFIYVPTVMGSLPVTLSVSQLAPGLIFVGGTISGVLAAVGIGTLTVSATNTDGSDTRNVYIEVRESALAAPANLRVNSAAIAATYGPGDSAVVTWSSDLTLSTILRFYTIAGQLMLETKLDPGVEVFVLDNAHIISTFGSESDFRVRAYSSDGTNESGDYAEVTVTRSSAPVSSPMAVYWGVQADPTITDPEIAALSSAVQTSRALSVTLNPSAQYLYFAFPVAFGSPAFYISGLLTTAWVLTTRSYGGVSYNIYRSTNILTGSYPVVVV